MKRIELIGIDLQNSFCQKVPEKEQQIIHSGELYVPGAWEASFTIATFIRRLSKMINDIKLTLDSHHQLHCAHPIYHREVKTGEMPLPFTVMRRENGKTIGARFNSGTGRMEDVGEYRTVRLAFQKDFNDYLDRLQATGRCAHTIWPPHCLIATPGSNLVAPVAEAVLEWERENIGFATKKTKGSNFRREHFSAVRAEVVDPEDTFTDLDTEFIGLFAEADEIIIVGQAKNFCVRNTIRDMANTFKDDSFIKKCVLLEDCMNDVPGFEQYSKEFLDEMIPRGLRVTTSTDYLA